MARYDRGDEAKKGDGMGPWLMLCFGVLAVGFGIYEHVRLARQPAPLAVACEIGAIEAVEEGSWIVVEGCFVDWDSATTRTLTERERQVVPIRVVDGESSIAALVTAARHDDDATGVATIEGVVGERIDGVRSLDREDLPNRGTAIFGIAAGVVLLGLAVFYYRKMLRAAAEPRASAPTVAATYASAAPYESPRVPIARKKGTFLDRGDDFNFILLFAVPPIIGVGMVAGHFVGATPDRLEPRLIAILVVPFGLLFAWAMLQQLGQDRFASRVRAAGRFEGSVVDSGERIDASTQIVVFEHVVSFVVLSISFASRPLIVGIDRVWPTQVIATTITFLFGWWGFPTAPFKTIAVLNRNLRGGRREQLVDLEGPLDRIHGPRADA